MQKERLLARMSLLPRLFLRRTRAKGFTIVRRPLTGVRARVQKFMKHSHRNLQLRPDRTRAAVVGGLYNRVRARDFECKKAILPAHYGPGLVKIFSVRRRRRRVPLYCHCRWGKRWCKKIRDFTGS